MILFKVIPAVTLLLSISLPADVGTLVGKIMLPEKDPIKRMTARYRDTDARFLGEPAPMIAVVYLSNPETTAQTIPLPQPSIMAQRGLHFHPRILPITLGSTVEFPNEDDTFHNVFSYSPTKEFDLGRYRKDENPPARTFREAGSVSLFCEVHRHMQAHILVLETPYFASTDAEGTFTLECIPAGTYTATVWLSPRDQRTQEVVIHAGKPTELNL